MAMTEAKRYEEQWIPTLRKRLTGKALSTFKEISLEDDAPFVTLKEDLLKRMEQLLTMLVIKAERRSTDFHQEDVHSHQQGEGNLEYSG